MKDARAILTPDLAETYAREGVVRLPGLVPSAEAAAMAATLQRKVEARRDRPARPAQLSSRTGQFDAMATPAVRGLLDEVLGRWDEPPHWGLPLVAYHTGEAAWDVPHQHWHLDLGGPSEAPQLARLFVVLQTSRPGGGGTVYVAGSHHLVQAAIAEAGPLRSAQARQRLEARSPWFAGLTRPAPGEDRVARFMHDGAEVDGVFVRVCEMLGEPGDVLLMHPLTLHAGAPNVRDTPRMMLTQFVYGTR